MQLHETLSARFETDRYKRFFPASLEIRYQDTMSELQIRLSVVGGELKKEVEHGPPKGTFIPRNVFCNLKMLPPLSLSRSVSRP